MHIHKQIFNFFSTISFKFSFCVHGNYEHQFSKEQFSLCGEIVFYSIMLEVDYFHIYLFEQNNWPQINMKHCVNVTKIMGRNIVGLSYYFLLILTVYCLYQLLRLSENRQAILCKAIAKAYLHSYWWFRAIIPRAVCKYSAQRHRCLS